MDYTKIDYRIVAKHYDKGFAKTLEALEVTSIVNVNEFVKTKHFYPAIESIWVYGAGSFVDESESHGTIGTYNGTLIIIGDSHVPFGSEYYKDVFGESLIDQRKYDEKAARFRNPGEIIDGVTVINSEGANKIREKITNIVVDPKYQLYLNSFNNKSVIYTITDTDDNKYFLRSHLIKFN